MISENENYNTLKSSILKLEIGESFKQKMLNI